MQLNVNSPAYFTQHFGIDDEIYVMCREIANYFKCKEYSDDLSIIGIIPIIAPKALTDSGLYKETKKYQRKCKLAIVSLHIDYDTYLNATIEKRKSMIIYNILQSIQAISKKSNFNYTLFENDFMMLCKMLNIQAIK